MNLNESKSKKQKIIGIAILAIAVISMLLIFWFIGKPLVKFVSQPELFREWVNSYGIWGRLAFIGMVILQVIVAIIPGEPFELVAGYAFGAVEGTVLCIIASTIGSILVFLLVRKFGVKLVEIFFSKEKLDNIKFLKSSPKRNILFLIIFAIPGTPKDLLSYFAGLTDISLVSWCLISSLGRIPSVITSTIGGSLMSDKNYLFAIIVFVVTVVISAGGLVIYNKICEKHKK